jgi:hypothetical protein
VDKQIRAAVFERATPAGEDYAVCEGCSLENASELHHSIGGVGKRTQHESVETCFALGNKCHGLIESPHGAPLRRKLILIAQQRYFDQGLTEDEVRVKMGGKIYGPLEVKNDTDKNI